MAIEIYINSGVKSAMCFILTPLSSLSAILLVNFNCMFSECGYNLSWVGCQSMVVLSSFIPVSAVLFYIPVVLTVVQRYETGDAWPRNKISRGERVNLECEHAGNSKFDILAYNCVVSVDIPKNSTL